MKEMSELGPPRGFLADMFPILAQIPVWMQTWRKEALKYYRTQESLWTKLYLELQSDMEKGKAPDCFVKQLIETEFRKQGISELQAAFVSGSKPPQFSVSQLPSLQLKGTVS
jgi:phenylalanine-4-hydroxylase